MAVDDLRPGAPEDAATADAESGGDGDGGGASGEAVLSRLRNMSQVLSLDTEARTSTVYAKADAAQRIASALPESLSQR